jgi:glycerate kinase
LQYYENNAEGLFRRNTTDGTDDITDGVRIIFNNLKVLSLEDVAEATIMHILIAPNAFKNSLNAADAASAIGKGLQQSKLNCSFEYFPIGDGGDGTAALIIQKHSGTIINAKVHDALGRNVHGSFGVIDNGNTAVIELADASGIRLLRPHELNPLHATTNGTGELIKHALNKEVSKLIMCIGGSATVDGGTGILQALGARFFNNENEILKGLPESLVNLTSIDFSGLDKRILNCELIILCDVENKLLGEAGAAKIFGPQKGASPEDVQKLEDALAKFRAITLHETGKDMAAIQYGGAAGGVAAGLAVFCNAKPVNGIGYFLTITDFDEALQKADLVITGEGSIDAQTLNGKGPYGVAVRAKEKNIPVIGIAGKVPLTADAPLQKYFDVLLAINNEPFEIAEAIKNTKDNLVRTGNVIGDLLAMRINE